MTKREEDKKHTETKTRQNKTEEKLKLIKLSMEGIQRLESFLYK